MSVSILSVVITSYIEPKKIKTIVDVSNQCLLRREFQFQLFM